MQGRVKGNRLNTVNKHFGDWLLLHLLMKNIDRRTFQEIVNQLCDDKAGRSPLTRVLTNISADMEGGGGRDTARDAAEARPRDGAEEEENTDERDAFFLPGSGRLRKMAVNFEDS